MPIGVLPFISCHISRAPKYPVVSVDEMFEGKNKQTEALHAV